MYTIRAGARVLNLKVMVGNNCRHLHFHGLLRPSKTAVQIRCRWGYPAIEEISTGLMIAIHDIRRCIELINADHVASARSTCGQNLVQVLKYTTSFAVRLR